MSALTAVKKSLSTVGPTGPAREAFARANSNAGHNVFLAMDQEKTLAEAEALSSRFPNPEQRPALYGVPVAIKDCFDVAGFPTTCGSRFYAEKLGVAKADSTVAARLRQAGAVIMGKTHLHQLAYGITGQNSEYGDCLQPRDPLQFTGGSSSGSAASVQEGSSVAAIGTDTGGSIRVPAALCGLAGYRSTLGLGGEEVWQGGWHLAASFDTLGWLFRDLRDGPVLAAALFGVKPVAAPKDVIVAAVSGPYLNDCEPTVREMYNGWQETLRKEGAQIEAYTPDFWADSREIFGGIQAHEAAVVHRGYFDHFEKTVTDRLTWGASLSAATVEDLRQRHIAFRAQMDHLLEQYDFLMLPCAPISKMPAAMDHAESRLHILRYTTPISLAGMPAVVLAAPGGGVQLVGARGSDARLLAFAASLKAGDATLPS